MQLATFLQLSPEFGGTKFGPFQGVEIRLGSDPDTNDISLPEALGVASQHLKVLQQGEHNFIIAPVDRTATVYIWRENSNKPKQITTPMAVKAGDGFSLVTPEGPRFYILQEHLQKDRDTVGGSFADKAMKRMPTSRGLLEEIKRRGFAKVFSTKIGNFVMYAYRFVVTGQIFNPIYVVAGIMMMSGWMFAGGASCAAFSVNTGKRDFQEKWQVCESQRSGIDPNSGADAKPTIQSLTRAILRDNEWAPTLKDDRDLYPFYTAELSAAFDRAEQFSWTFRNDKTKVAQLRKALSALPPNLTETLTFLAAHPSRTGARDWRVVEDSEGDEVCGRGPLGLTYRQATRLGLTNVQLDALVSNTFAMSQDIEAKRNALLKTADFLPTPLSMDGRVIAQTGGVLDQGGRECMHVEGPDDRDDINALAARLRVEVGSSVRGLPDEGQPYWIAQRLMKLAAMDYKFGYENLRFNLPGKTPTQSLANQDVQGKRLEFAAKWSSRVMAAAITAKCGLVLDDEFADAPPDYLGAPPDIFQCGAIQLFVKYRRL